MARPTAQRGVTRFEAGLVAGGLVLLGSIVAAVAAPAASSQDAVADRELATLAEGAERWRGDHSGCPSASLLVRDGVLPEGTRVDDPWGERYRLSCESDGIVARSGGPDRKLGTGDDRRVRR